VSETSAERRRRKAAAGVGDQLAAGLGAWSGGVFAAGVVAPFVAGLIGAARVPLPNLMLLALSSLLIAMALLVAAALFKARAKLLDDDTLVIAGELPVERDYKVDLEAHDD
jgi:hypothetical protein